MGWLRKRFGEQSTYAGMGYLATVFAYLAGPEAVAAVSPLAGAAIALYEMIRSEKD